MGARAVLARRPKIALNLFLDPGIDQTPTLTCALGEVFACDAPK